MPIRVPNELPAKEILEKEEIFIMNESRAVSQDIRALKIVILNLMPIKQETEVQLLRLLGNTPLQVDITLLRLASHASKNTSIEYLEAFYKTFDQIEEEKFDGMIITGAPVEHMAFEEVMYWNELTEIMEWSKEHVTSNLHICWGAQAGLYYHYGINKEMLEQKMFGIFEHEKLGYEKILQGLDDLVYIPHSRHTQIDEKALLTCKDLKILLRSKEAGVALVASEDRKNIFAMGHSEYDAETLDKEYRRDKERGIDIKKPIHYYFEEEREKGIQMKWKSHAYLLFSNWLNYYVYQVTPYNLSEIC